MAKRNGAKLMPMYSLLNQYEVKFPTHYGEVYTLRDFLKALRSPNSDEYDLPIIVNILSLNNYGREIRKLPPKTTSLLLFNVCQLDSVVAEYFRSPDGRQHVHRSRLSFGKSSNKAQTKYATVKKLSKSLATVTTFSPKLVSSENGSEIDNLDNNYLDENKFDAYYQQKLINALNENYSSSTPICRIPKPYSSYFELLNENDKSIEPYHKLSDLILNRSDNNGRETQVTKWPYAILLRSHCKAYKEKYVPTNVNVSQDNEMNSEFINEDGSCLDMTVVLESSKKPIELYENSTLLEPGQVLNILHDCYAIRRPTTDTETNEQKYSVSSSASLLSSTAAAHLSPGAWVRQKSKELFSKRRRPTFSTESLSKENMNSQHTVVEEKPYLKCRTLRDGIVYIYLHEPVVFSSLSTQNEHLTLNQELDNTCVPSVFQIHNILSSFRFPVSVRLLDGLDADDHASSTTTIHRDETSSITGIKFRLHMSYIEDVVFVCPLNLLSQKNSKHLPACSVFPISINADILIQPCKNMSSISETTTFQAILEACKEQMTSYQTEISIINTPLELRQEIKHKKEPLKSKRSQSESNVCDLLKEKLRYDSKITYNAVGYCDDSASLMFSANYRRNSNEETERHAENDSQTQNSPNILGSNDEDFVHTRPNMVCNDGRDCEDEMYEEVDKIYDYVRFGDLTSEIAKIQKKEQPNIDIKALKKRGQQKQVIQQQNTIYPQGPPPPIFSDRFRQLLKNHQMGLQDTDIDPFQNDGNVDTEQAHALFIASKSRSKDNIFQAAKPNDDENSR